MGTFGRVSDTRNPFKKAMARLNSIGLGPSLLSARWEEGDVTFTQEQVTEQVNTAVAEAQKGGGNWYNTLPQDIKTHPTITRYKTGEEFAKGHLALEKTVGLKGVLVPVDGSSDDVKGKFFTAIGRPEAADNYANPVLENLHEGVKTTSEQDLKAFKDKAFELGMSGKQFSELYDWYLKTQSQRLTDWDKLQTDEKNQAATALRNRWGAKHEERLALANGLIQKFGSKDLVAKLEESGFGSNPDVIELLATIGAQFSEDQLGELGRSGMGKTPEQAKMEISEVTKQIMETQQGDPLYAELLKKKDSLYKIAYPSGAPQ